MKPVEYRDIKITYKDYFIYIKSLLNLNEISLIMKVLSLNKNFLDINAIEKINKLIRAYFIVSLRKELNKFIGGISIDEIELFFKKYNFSFEDFQLDKKKILDNFNDMNPNRINFNKFICNYLSDNITLSNEDISLLEHYKIFNLEKEINAPLVSLYKYEKLLFLYPGSFFGDSALDSQLKKRNATIRVEEDSIICSLHYKYYTTLLSETNKKLKLIDLNFLCNNFFFNEISPVIFNKYYYDLFRPIEKEKNDLIYKQNDNNSYVYFLIEGIIKTELNASLLDLSNLIKKIFEEISSKLNNFKISLDDFMKLRNKYLFDNKNNDKKEKDIFMENNKKNNFELFSSNGYECLGIYEYFFNVNNRTTCRVISNKAKFMVIKNDDLTKILNNEREILPRFHKLIYIKLLSFIKRIYYLKNISINQILDKNKGIEYESLDKTQTKYNSYTDRFTNINMKNNNNHKKNIEIVDSEKIKNIYLKKISAEINNNNYNKSLSSINISLSDSKKSKNFSSNKLISFQNNKYFKILNSDKNKLKIRKKLLSNSNLNLLNNEFNSSNKFINASLTNRNKNNQSLIENNDDMHHINNDTIKKTSKIIDIKKGFLSLNNIKLNILKKYICSSNKDKSFQIEFPYCCNNKLNDNNNNKIYKKINLKKNDEEGENKNNILIINKEDKEEDYNNKINSSFYINNKSYRKDDNQKLKQKLDFNCYNFSSLPSIKKANKKINILIRDMKEKYSIKLGKKKIIYYRSPKKNKSINIIEENNKGNSIKKNIIQTIKDFYFKKKLEGYSSFINPINNTYFNRQKTIKIKKNYIE